MGGAAGGGAAGKGAGASGVGGSGGVAGGGVAGAAGSGATRTYTTMFPLTENPISENGSWINGGTDGPRLARRLDDARPRHRSPERASYTDGTALLTGSWGPTQTVEAVVHAVNPKEACYQEVEMRLRSALSPHSCTGYEISFKATKSRGAYLIIVRWNGPLGDFSYLLNVNGAKYGVTEGDMVKATIVRQRHHRLPQRRRGRHGDRQHVRDGSPGMGFNLETGDASCVGTNGDYGYTRYSATAGP